VAVKKLKSINLELESLQARQRALDRFACLLQLDANGKILEVNHRVVELLGFSESELVHQDLSYLVFNYSSSGSLTKMWGTLRSGKIWAGEFNAKRRDGKNYWLQVTVAPVLDTQGKIKSYVLIGNDIMDQKKMEELKDGFISAVSHEIRTPLTLIRAAVSNLLDGVVGSLTPQQLKVLDIASRSCDRLTRIINDLLDLSRLESDRIRAKLQRVDVAYLLHEAVQEFYEDAQKQNIKLKIKIPAGISDIEADFNWITRVLDHLVHNALRFAKSEVVVEAKDLGELIQIGVLDDGVGVSSENKAKLFEKFIQLDRPAGGAGYKGTGLGLAICREILNMHESKIWVESESGRGAQFYFLLSKSRELPVVIPFN